MLMKTITDIEAKIENTCLMKEEDKTDLLNLISTLKSEISELSKTHAEQAQSITNFAQVSTHEATREQKNTNLMEVSLTGLTSSVDEFENTHPKLVETVNRISKILANMGI